MPNGLSGVIRHGTVLRETVQVGESFTSTAVAQHSSKCLDVPNDTTATQLQQYACNGQVRLSFEFQPVGPIRTGSSTHRQRTLRGHRRRLQQQQRQNPMDLAAPVTRPSS